MPILRCAIAAVLLAGCAGGQTRPDEKPAAADGSPDKPGSAQSPADAADEASFKNAQKLAKEGKLDAARAALSDILENHPTSKYKQEAAIELGLVQARMGKKQDAEQTLKPALQGMTPEQRKQANDALNEAIAQGGAGDAALAAKALNDASDGDRQKKLEEYVTKLDATAAPAVAKLAAELDHQSPAWPPAAVKLARIQITSATALTPRRCSMRSPPRTARRRRTTRPARSATS